MSARAGRFRPDGYLILLFAMVGAATLAPATGQAAALLGWATKLAIAFVFFLHGARLSREAVVKGLTHWRLHLVVLLATYALFPVVCLGLAALGPTELAAGIVFLGCLPSTIQSSVGFTAIARGNVAAAVAAASASNLLGVALTPLLVAALLHADGSISAASIWTIVLQLLAPFVAGQLLRPLVGGWVAKQAKLLSLADRGAILLVVYVAFSSAVAEGVWSRLGVQDLILLVLLSSGLLALVLALTWAAARALRFDKPDEIAIVFCGSKKSLASGVPMAAALFPAAAAGVLLIPLMIFHQLQLMACAWIAQRYAAREGAP